MSSSKAQHRGRLGAAHRRGGFTLVEVLVTMALMAVILPVAMRGISIAVATASSARHKSEAAMLAQSKLNEIVADVTILGETTQVGSSGDFGETWPAYRWSTTTMDDSTLGLSHLTISVVWTERGHERTFEASTLVQYPDVAVGTLDTGG
jgi:general secretion pathway protein I